MRIAIASDHAGYQFKEKLKAYLKNNGYKVVDFGTNNDIANMISIGARMMSEIAAIKIVKMWLNAEFEGGRHIPRIEKVNQLGELDA